MEKETYTKEEVIDMLKNMQVKAAKCRGFMVGQVPQTWVISTLLGSQIKELGGEPYVIDKDGRMEYDD